MPRISEAQRSDRRQAVLRAAETVFSRRGFVEATIDDVAHEAGVSKGYVYTYFPTKEDIFFGVVGDFDNATSRWDRLTDTITSTRGMSVEHRLIALWDAIADQWSGESLSRLKLQLEIWTQSSRNARLQEVMDSRSLRSLRLVETILEESAPSTMSETHYSSLARLWWAAIDGLVLNWIVHGTTPSSNERQQLRNTIVLLTQRIFASP